MSLGSKLPAAAGLCLLALGAAAAEPRRGEDLTVIGFSGDGKLFAAVVAHPGEQVGALRLWDAVTGKPLERASEKIALGPDRRAAPRADLLAELHLGGDPGAESYASGTPRATDFTVAGAPTHVELAPRTGKGRVTAVVSIQRGKCRKEIATGAPGRELNLVNVLRSKDWGALAVVFKYTDGGLRRYGVAPVRLADGPLADPACLGQKGPPPAPATAGKPEARGGAAPSPKCLGALRSLKGKYTGVERIRDLDGKTEVPLFVLQIDAHGDRPVIVLSANPGMGAVVCGAIVGCEAKNGELVVSTHDPSDACLDASVRIRSLPGGALEVDHQDMTETYHRG